MRYILSIISIIVLLLPYPQTIVAEKDDTQSLIIEVTGDPQVHKEYIEAHHPYVEVVASYEMLFKGLAIRGTPTRLAKMEALPFVKAIHSVQQYQSDKTKKSSLKADALPKDAVYPEVFNNTRYTGKGIKVGVIDTGIDYNHPDLQANFVKGYDLVDLDDDPMETQANQGIPTLHGTHVAGIIAADGELKGVAPDAEIYAYRALGPGGSGTSVQVIAAMEQAVKDGVDVMNLSLGNNVNGPDYPTSLAVNRAAALGVAVVIANGNNGPADWTVGSPATASKAISVGATSPAKQNPYLYARWEDREIGLTSMVGSVPWNLDTFYKIAVEGEELSRKIVVLQRGEIPFYDMAKQAEKDGAIAVLIANSEEGTFQGSIDKADAPITIPVASISKEDGQWLQQMAEESTLQLETQYKELPASVADFSSRGPVTINWDIKPDVLAPGTNIMSSVPGGYQALQGTSMAAPHVAGAIALMKEAHPDWSNDQIIGALKTTAWKMQQDDKAVAPIMQGSGVMDPDAAINATTIINDPALAYGKFTTYREEKSKQLFITNQSDETKSYTFTIPKKQGGIQWSLPQRFVLKPGEEKAVPVQLAITSKQLEEGVHQGWLTVDEGDNRYLLPYLFINQTADNPKAMGFEFALQPFSEEGYIYKLYLAENAESAKVDLYDPDSLMFERTLLELDEVKTGENEGQLTKKQLGAPGEYMALITVRLDDGSTESYQTDLIIRN
ncbi:S8 family serine peptidase [Oceanobacillus jordanicus]|uniref:S8 family serine peptidase n=1 Tax=Oceanobacillus jordanicus TaxID=2867266 RepID=A0AAW5B450_9BACI|nr:S8 family serine peptidase [Oceanobacillus jordanicus]MCG3417934.1 S8 family serine peptidase [Oceanobacillus jordanicus]